MSKAQKGSAGAPYTHSLRITFSIDSQAIEVQSVARVAMRAPAPATTQPKEGSTGYWLEVRGAKGEVLYHRPFRNPLPDSAEVFDDQEGGKIHRVPAKPTQAKFDAIVPDLAAATEIAVFGARLKDKAKHKGMASSVELVRHPMEALRKAGADAARGIKPQKDQSDKKGGA